jgi:hypothetical protein
MQTCRWVPTFKRNIPPPSSGLKEEAVVSSKMMFQPTCPHSIITQKTSGNSLTAMKNSNLKKNMSGEYKILVT